MADEPKPAVELWTSEAMNAALTERDRLADIIDRAHDELDAADLTLWHRAGEVLEGVAIPEAGELAQKLFNAHRSVSKALMILGEGMPQDLEAEHG